MQAIDRGALDVQTGGDTDLACEILALFAGQCRSILPGIVDRALPPDQRADLAHALKGSAAGVGATRIHALADVTEARLRAGDGPAPLDELAAAVGVALAEIEGGQG